MSTSTNALASNELTNIVIYGLGNVGLAFSNLLIKNGFSVTLTGRNLEKVRKQASLLSKPGTISAPKEAVANADLVLLTVTDGAIKEVADSLIPNINPTAVLAHCSGALKSTELVGLTTIKTISICSLHPLNTFPTVASSIDLFSGTHQTTIYAEGDPFALDQCRGWFENLEFKFVEIDSDAKTLYHSACVLACNYLVALMESSLSTAESAGVERTQFWQSIEPLIQSTLSNISQHGTVASLSGPIVRGDLETIASHIQALTDVDQLTRSTYTNLGLQALKIAGKQGDLTNKQVDQITKILNS